MLCSASKYGATYLSRILSARVVLSKVLASRIAMFDLSSRVAFLSCVLLSILRFSSMLNEIDFPWVVKSRFVLSLARLRLGEFSA